MRRIIATIFVGLALAFPAIIGATAVTYKPTSADVGKAMTVKVTAYKTGYTTAVKTSAATAAVVK